MAGVVLNSFTKAQLVEHLQIKAGTLLKALRLNQLAVFDKLIQANTQFSLDGFNGFENCLAWGYIVRTWVDSKARNLLANSSSERIKELQAFNYIIKQFHSHCQLIMFGRENINCVATHPEYTALEICFIAVVLHGNQAHQNIALAHLIARTQSHHHAVIVTRITDTVNRRHGCNDDDITSLQ